MSKRVGSIPSETREWILNAALEEFSEHNYNESSLRRICQKAGVTTGAIYFLFEDKEDLFKKIILTVDEPLSEKLNAHFEDEKAKVEDNVYPSDEENFTVTKIFIDSYFSNKTVWNIILKNINHPVITEFNNKFVKRSTEHYMAILEAHAKKTGRELKVDRYEVEHFVRLQSSSILILMGYNFNEEEMAKHLVTSIKMLRGAFKALIED